MKNIIIAVISVIAFSVSAYEIIITVPYFFEEVGVRDVFERVPVAPNFVLSDLHGGKIALSSFRNGKGAMLVFWTSWNPVSVDYLNAVDDYQAHFAPTDIAIFAINSQEDASIARRLASEHGWSLQIVSDREGSVGEEYHVGTLPLTVFIDRTGHIKKSLVGKLSRADFDREIAELHQYQ